MFVFLNWPYNLLCSFTVQQLREKKLTSQITPESTDKCIKGQTELTLLTPSDVIEPSNKPAKWPTCFSTQLWLLVQRCFMASRRQILCPVYMLQGSIFGAVAGKK